MISLPDRTFEIEQEFEKNYPDKIKVMRRTEGKGGSKENFWALCQEAVKMDADYFMFCDQDDVWNPDKIEITLKRMQKVEKKNPKKPVLVHTDLEVVDQNLNSLGASFVRYRALDAKITAINRLLVQNNVTGCTMMINRPLLEKALKLSNISAIAMHDWWFSLVASLFGEISFIDQATIKYRQHGDNVVGATKVNTPSFILQRLRGKTIFMKFFICLLCRHRNCFKFMAMNFLIIKNRTLRQWRGLKRKIKLHEFIRCFTIICLSRVLFR